MTEAPGTLETISGSTMAHQAKPLQQSNGDFSIFFGVAKNPPMIVAPHSSPPPIKNKGIIKGLLMGSLN